METRLAINVKEMAQMLNISIPVAYALTERADFPCIRVSEKRKIIPLSALEVWLSAQAGKSV